MKKNFYALTMMAAAFGFVAFSNADVCAQKKNGGASRDAARAASKTAGTDAKALASPLNALPQSDAVLLVDVHRLIDEALPKVFASNQEKLAAANAELAKFKEQTGLDTRSFDQVAVGTRLTDDAGNRSKLDPIVIAHGAFSPGALVFGSKIAAGNGKYREEKYNGQTITIFPVADQVKLLGLFKINAGELAVTALDGRTLAFGNPVMVRAAIDVRGGRRARVANDVVALVGRNQNALMAFGVVVPQTLTQNVSFGSDEISRSVASIRQFYGAINAHENGFDTMTAFVTASKDDAERLSDSVSALKQFAPFIVGRLGGARGKAARSALDSLQIGAQGNEVQLRASISQPDLDALLKTN